MNVKKVMGIILLAAGIIALGLSVGADVMGIGGNTDVFGLHQILGTVGGIVLVAAGLFLTLKKAPEGSLSA